MRNLPILYKPTETEFGHMGEGVLRDAISCIVTENQNGEYELELKYPINGIRSELLNYDMIIKAKANEEFDSQLFRIYSIRQDLNHNKVIRARHIFYDLLDNFIEKLSLNNTTCTQAGIALLNACTYPTPFTFEVSDITHTGNFNIERVNPVQAIAGVDGSMIDTFGNGATIIRNNFKIGAKQNKAPISDVLIAYRKNLTGFERTVDTSNVATKIYPFAIVESGNGDESTKTVITLPEKYISNPYVDNYANPKIIPYDFSGNDVTTEDQLRAKARAYFTDDRGLPDINYEISFVPLNKTVEYSNFQLLETVTIGTDVTVFDERFNLKISTKVIKTVYDSLAGRYTSIELGKQKTNLAISKIESEQKLEDKINNSNSSIENMNKLLINAIKNATDQITGADGGYVRLNPKDNPQEILIMDHPDISQAKNIWRFNKNGLGHSTTGYNGQYGLAMTADGQIVADKITSGSLNAGLIKVGILMCANKNTWINMDTGTFNFGDKISFDGTNLTIRLQDGKTVEEGISAVNNKIDSMEIGGRNLFAFKYINPSTSFVQKDKNILEMSAWAGLITTNANLIKIIEPNTQYTFRTKIKILSLSDLPPYDTKISFLLYKNGGPSVALFNYNVKNSNVGDIIEVTNTFTSVEDLTGYGILAYSARYTDGTTVELGRVQLIDFTLVKGNKPMIDWVPAPEDVDSAISTVDNKIATTNNKVASIETNLNSITQRVSSTESTVSTHTTQLGTVDNRINTAKNTAISTASADATSKANNAQTNAVNSAKSYTDGQITTVNKTITDKVAEIKLTTDSITQRVSKTESTLTSTTATANNANSKINNLQIGSRNLILNSKTILLKGSDNGNQNCSVIENDYVKITPKYNGNVYNTSAVATSVTRLQGETYTLSFEILTPTTIGFYFYPSEHYTKSKYIVANSKWQKVSFTYTQTGANSSSKKLFGFHQLVAGQTYYYRNLKLEKGNKATDWSPAPEDVDSAITIVDNKVATTSNKVAIIETNLNGITQRVSSTESTVSTHTTQLGTVDSRINTAKNSAISTASSDATNKANSALNSAKDYTNGQITTVNKTITDKVAEIKLTTDNITQRVSKTESTISSHTTELGKVDNKINTAINNVQVGGRNLLSQSDKFNKGSGSTGISSVVNSDGTLSVTASRGNGNWFTGWAKSYGVAETNFNEGDLFTISFTMKSSNTTSKPTVYIKSGMGYYAMSGTMSSNWSTIYCSGIWKKANGMNLHLGFSGIVGTIDIKNWKIEKGNKPTSWTPAPEDVDLAITTVDNRIETTNNKVATIETNLNGITQRVQSTESTVSTHTTQLGTVDSRINTAKNSAISTASADATSKANNAQTNAINSSKSYTDGQITTVNKTITDKVAEIKLTTDSITQRVSKTESTLTSTTTTANNALANANNANNKIDNLQIGSRNLILKSKHLNDNSSSWIVVNIKVTKSEDYMRFSPITTSTDGHAYFWENSYKRLSQTLVKGKIYTMSFDVRTNCSKFRVGFRKDPANQVLYDYRNSKRIGEWDRYYFTFTWSTHDWNNILWLVGVKEGGTDKYIDVKNWKLEEGNKPTTWTPAPEDIDSAITTVDNKIETTNNKVATIETNLNSITSRVSSTESNITTINGNISSLQSRMSSAEQKITPNAIVSTVQSTINTAKTEAINSANSATDKKLQDYTTKASMELTASQLRLDFSSSGGMNLVKDGQFKSWDFNNGKWWWFDSNLRLYSHCTENTGVGFYSEDGNVARLYSNYLNFKPNTTYTLRLDLVKEVNVYWSEVYIEFKTRDDSIINTIACSTNGYTFTTPNNCEHGYVILAHGGRSSTVGAYVLWVDNVALYEGTTQLPYSPHPDEVYEGNTIIDVNGITVNNGALTIKNNAGATVFSGGADGNLTLAGTVKSQSGDMYVSLNSGGLTFQDWNRNEQILRVAMSYFPSNRDMNGISFAMPKYSDFLRFSYIDKEDLTGGWSSSNSQYKFMDFWSGSYTVGGVYYAKGIHAHAPLHIDGDGIFMKSGTNHTSDIKGNLIWNGINGLLGVIGDNGCFIGYKNGDEYRSRMVLTEGAHPGTGDQIKSWGNWNCSGYTVHNAKVNALSLSVSGSKNCLQKTENYGNRLINAYETAEYYFGDLGFGRINPDGECLVSIDDIFQECVNTKIDYHVFTQCYNGSIESIEKYETYFIVKGKPETEFSWELKAKRINYENNRLDTEEIAQTFISDYESEIDTYKVDTSEDALLGDIMFDLELILMGE